LPPVPSVNIPSWRWPFCAKRQIPPVQQSSWLLKIKRRREPSSQSWIDLKFRNSGQLIDQYAAKRLDVRYNLNQKR
ncbi:MAG TPA: hypothetical protein DCM07_06940, partial [Planctomycetaceae bacterium]|nr:hypothetical protein [Planctomycetaceae bacterium]